MRESTLKRKRSAVAVAGDWSDAIPTELLSLVAEKIDSVRTKIAFGAVCRSWCSVISPNPITQSTPWLMLAPHHKHSRTFYSFRTDSLFNLDFPLNINTRRCWGSPFGWIIAYNCNQHSGFDLRLYNPISRASIPLPNLLPFLTTWCERYNRGSFPEYVLRVKFIEKAVLTANPESPHCLVIIIPAIDGGELLYAKPGDITWSVNSKAGLGDILNFRGNLYGCNWEVGSIFTLEISDNMELALKGFALAPPQMIERSEEVAHECHRKKYLVDVGGDLYLVLRYTHVGYEDLPDIDDCYLTYDFEVYKLDFSTKVWKLVKSLGDYCVFIGTNNAFAVPASPDNPFTVHSDNGICLRPNCIYFLDDNAFDKKSDGFDMGVFHVGESFFGVRPLGENVEVLFCIDQVTPQPFMLKTLASGLYSPSCPPLWITPCIRFKVDENFDNGKRRSSIDHHLPKKAKNRKLTNTKDTKASQLRKASSGAKSNRDKVKNRRRKITPEDEDEDDERRKLIFQLKNQFTYIEGHGVDRIYQGRFNFDLADFQEE